MAGQFLKYKITPEDLALADGILSTTPIYKGSHRKQAANEVGVLGEVVVRRWLQYNNIPFKVTNTTQHDLLLDGMTLEVKTKDRTVDPKVDYEASVPLYNHSHQTPDRYVFVSLKRNKRVSGLEKFEYAFLLGTITLDGLHEVGVTRTNNDRTGSGKAFWTDCINVFHYDLLSPREFMNYLAPVAQSG